MGGGDDERTDGSPRRASSGGAREKGGLWRECSHNRPPLFFRKALLRGTTCVYETLRDGTRDHVYVHHGSLGP